MRWLKPCGSIRYSSYLPTFLPSYLPTFLHATWQVAQAKPHPDGLIDCCKALGVEPSASVYIGDSPSDGKAAKAAGMRSVGVLWGANSREQLEGEFDALAADVPALAGALRAMLLPPKE